MAAEKVNWCNATNSECFGCMWCDAPEQCTFHGVREIIPPVENRCVTCGTALDEGEGQVCKACLERHGV